MHQFHTLQQVYSDYKGEAPLDAPLEADGKPGVFKVGLAYHPQAAERAAENT